MKIEIIITILALVYILPASIGASVEIVGKDLNVYDGNIILYGQILGPLGRITIDSNIIITQSTTTETLHANSISVLSTAAIYGALVLSNLQSCGYLYTDSDGTVQCSTVSIVGGSGDTNYLAKWTSSTSIGSSTVYDSGEGIGIFTSTPQYELDINGTARSTNILATTITAEGTVYADTVDAGQYKISGTTVIDASRNITNINSITAAGPMNIDSGTLYVDSTNNMVGIGTTAPGFEIDVNGYANASALCIGGHCITDWSQTKKGVAIELRCGAGFYNNGSVATGCTTSPSCPTGWTKIGTGTEWLYYTSYYYGNQVSVCYSDTYSECIRLRCGAAFYTSGGTAYGCSSPPSCPAGWTAVASDYAFIDYTGSYHEGYREVWCCR